MSQHGMRSTSFAAVRPLAQLRTSRGAITVLEPAGGVLRTLVTGHLDGALFDAFRRVAEARYARGQALAHLHDWEGVSSYDAAVRVEFTQWLLERRALTLGVWVLVKMPVVLMGVTTANMATSAVGLRIEALAAREGFEQVALEQVRRSSYGPA